MPSRGRVQVVLCRLLHGWDGGDVPLDPDGFVHLSAPAQVVGTANRHYAGATDLVVLAVDDTALDPRVLRWETGGGAVPYPHHHAPLPAAAVGVALAFPPDADGAFTALPKGLRARVPVPAATVRDARPDDLTALSEVRWRSAGLAYEGIEDAAFRAAGMSPKAMAVRWADNLDDPATRVLVVERGGRVAGGITAGPDQDDPTIGFVSLLYVAPEAWGEGLGSVLRDAASAALRQAGHRRAALWTLERNVRAQALYASAGWSYVPGADREYAAGRCLRYEVDLAP